MIAQKASFATNSYSKIPQSFSRNYKKSHSVSMQQQVKMKAIIPDHLKAGGTWVKKMEVVAEKGGFRVNLVR